MCNTGVLYAQIKLTVCHKVLVRILHAVVFYVGMACKCRVQTEFSFTKSVPQVLILIFSNHSVAFCTLRKYFYTNSVYITY